MSIYFSESTIDITQKADAIIPEAQLLSEDLKVKLRVNTPRRTTSGKALLVESIPISQETTMSTFLQEDRSKKNTTSWIGFTTFHASNEDLKKQFERKKSINENHYMLQYPLYLAMVVFGILYAIIIKKTAIDKEPLIILQHQWLPILLYTAIFAIVEFFIYYYIFQQEFDFSNFKSEDLGRMRTFNFIYENTRYDILAICFVGNLFTLDNTSDKKLFGYGPGDRETLFMTEAKYDEKTGFMEEPPIPIIEKISNLYHKKIEYEHKIVNAYREWAEKENEIQDLKSDKIENLDDLEEKEEVENEASQLKNSYLQIESAYSAEIEKLDIEMNELKTTYIERMQEVIGRSIKKKLRQQYIFQDAYIMELEQINSNHIIKDVSNIRIIEGKNKVSSSMSDQVFETAIDLRNNDLNAKQRVISYVENESQNHGSNGNPGYYSNGVQNRTQGEPLDVNRMLTPIVWLIAIVAMLLTFGFVIKEIISSFGNTGPMTIILIFSLIVLILVVSAVVNRVASSYHQYSTKATPLKLNP